MLIAKSQQTFLHFRNMVCNIKFPLENPDIINNGLCRFCPFQVPNNDDGIKGLQTHYTADHPVFEAKNANLQMPMILQKQNNLLNITVGIYEVGKCIQQDCRFTKTDGEDYRMNGKNQFKLKLSLYFNLLWWLAVTFNKKG